MSVEVTSHVPRDLLQSAEQFGNERLVIWEYVSNSLDYVEPGVAPKVTVMIEPKKKRITIQDNGRGMDVEGLNNFFKMHAENRDRSAGRRVRGKFGTGKSAAFGIANLLTISTIKDGRRSKVRLSREALEQAVQTDRVPVELIESEVETSEKNGTLVEIEEIRLRSMDKARVISELEKQLAAWQDKSAKITVNGRLCEYHEPSVSAEYRFVPTPEQEQALGPNVELLVKVSQAPLDPVHRGISITSHGAFYEQTLLGIDGKDLSSYIFGSLEVPSLSTDTQVPAAHNQSRSQTLNPENPLVRAIYGFAGPHLVEVHQALKKESDAKRNEAEAKRLQEEASKIEDIINSDFVQFRSQLQSVRAKSGAGHDDGPNPEPARDYGENGSQEDFIFGGSEPAAVVSDQGGIGSLGEGAKSDEGPPRELMPEVTPDEDGDEKGRHEKTAPRKRQRGGFSVEFANHGADVERAVYDGDKRTIFINLDHPQIAAAKEGRPPEDPVFRRLAYEVAFSEYAVAIAYELANRDEYVDYFTPITDIRRTLNRVATAAASLYES